VRTKPRAEKGADLEAQVTITFDQAVAGAQVPLQVPMHAPCPTCHGTGAKPGTAPSVCPRCEGRGIETQGQGMFSISQPCSLCGGTGTVIEDPCPTCGGAGAVRTVKRLRVNIPAGVRDGSRIRLAGKGEPGHNGGPPGDLYLITHVEPSPLFTRKGNNLEVEVPLSIPEALRGADVQVPTLNGTKTLRVRPGTAHGTVQRLRGEGPPKLGGAGGKQEKGDIHYRFVIDVPQKLSDEQAQAVEELSKSMGASNPRAGLFAKEGAGDGSA
jgi:molecular chaperone DnaJ